MTKGKLDLLHRQDASATVEMALALPVLLAFFGAIFMLGNVFFIQASVNHATGEAARFATIYPSPSSNEIETIARNAMFGGSASSIRSVTVTSGIDDGRKFSEITMTYDYPMMSWFMQGSAKTLSQTKRAYLP